MKSPNRGAGNRSLLNHGGKGDVDRTTDCGAFRSNFDGIFFNSPPDGFFVTAHGIRKVYGASSQKTWGGFAGMYGPDDTGAS